jgi:hypothetical protein
MEVPDKFFFEKSRKSDENSKNKAKKTETTLRASSYIQYEERREKIEKQKVW